MNQPRPYVLAETNWKHVKDERYDVALLPWGATEAHNYHLPYATDNLQAEFVAVSSAERAWNQGVKSIVLPCVPFGVNTGQKEIKLCLNMMPSTQLSLLNDIAAVLGNAGINKLVIVNGHGGNHFKQMIRELSCMHPALFTCSIDWYKAINAYQFFEEPGDHAGELETSCLLHISPDLVLPLAQAGDGDARSFKIEGLRKGWVTAQRQWDQVSADTGVGNPQHASASKGESFLNASCEQIASFLVDLAGADIDAMYE